MGEYRLIRLGAAVGIGVGGFVHFQIWRHEYRHAPIREMFVANWVFSALIAVALLVAVASPRLAGTIGRLALLGGLALSAGSLVAFALSRGPGVPTLHGTFKETGLETTSSYVFHLGSAKAVLVSETLAVLLCGAALVRARSGD